jgi:valyl-tRNA synthetase
MLMLGLYLTDVEPFDTVYLHGIVRDPYGQKMSKTKGNVVDPLEMIQDIGADALRVALVSGNAPGVDQRLTDAKLTGGRNFTNKIWNAARFVLGAQPEPMAEPAGDETLPERWIRSRLAATVERATQQLEALDLAGYAATVHEFAWSDYCDWFLEMAKVELRREELTDGERARVWGTATEVFGDLLRLLHPLLPFVTEAIWEPLGEAAPRATRGELLLIRAAWPAAGAWDAAADRDLDALRDLIRTVRDQRMAAGAAAGAWLPLHVAAGGDDEQRVLESGAHYLEALARVRPLDVAADAGDRPASAATTTLGAFWLDTEAAADEAATARAAARRDELRHQVARLRDLLANEAFTGRAPAAVVERERARLADLEGQLAALGDDAG